MKKTLIPFMNVYKSYYDIYTVGGKGGGGLYCIFVFCTVGEKMGVILYFILQGEKGIIYCREKKGGVIMYFKL